MKKTPLLLTSMFAASISMQAQVIFQDGFSTSSGNNNLDINDSIGVTRQTAGTTSTYTHTGSTSQSNVSTNDDGTTNNGNTAGNSMGRIRNNEQTGGASNAFLSLDTNFGSSLAGEVYTISFDLHYKSRVTDSTDQWISFAIGDSVAPQAPSAAGSDFGILLRPDGVNPANNNLTRYYSDGILSASDDYTSTPSFTSSYVNFIVTVNETGAGTTIGATANGTAILSDFAADFATGDRYFAFGSHLGSGVSAFSDVFLDNLTITVVPEPSTYALIGGLLALGFASIKRRK
ncbi:PEP-CTERM sorting domain-containing protein [Coraliomargarita algicola]|uniref:PEP-CTERM sorting domain-containing protein n=1 Tax=Coraliomargarita algicola TaxID=3092156 RepID=A0ABZ0RVW0_9BACT|nr:PEP-CTERM sorting domain-containing protein [Coraliomargarita sp. J2-16]WPJ97114.1 PEP-CTERM sorting domain-containing protein [Coraliomargarita sp. J2-16]